MKYIEFKNMVKKWPIIFTRDLTRSAGFADALREAGFAAGGRDALVFGAGGAARAALCALGRLRARRVTIAARRPEAARIAS